MAAPLPPDASATVEALVEAVRADVDALAREPRSAVRWVRLDGLHLTIRFLGALPEARVAELSGAVDRAARMVRPADVVLAGSGAVPSPARPRTIWLAIADGADELGALARAVDAELEPLGWAPETRPFRPHLTLARADGRREGPLVAARLAERADGLAVPFRVDRLVLFESLTGGGPARYVARHEALVGG